MKKLGFTLLELLLVMSLMTILLSVAVLRFDFFAQINERNEMEKIVSQLQYSRNYAISTGEETVFYVEKDSGKNSFSTIIKTNSGKVIGERERYSYIHSLSGSFHINFKKTGASDKTEKKGFGGKVKKYEMIAHIGTGYITWGVAK